MPSDIYTQSFEDISSFPTPEQYHGIPENLIKAFGGKHQFRSFDSIKSESLPPEVAEYNKKFLKCIQQIKERHDPVAMMIAKGIIEYKGHMSPEPDPFISTAHSHRQHQHREQPLPADIQGFLDRFYMSRIGMRMLIGQHIALAEAAFPHPAASLLPKSLLDLARSLSSRAAGDMEEREEDYVGLVCKNTSLNRVVARAARDARAACEEYYGIGEVPKVKVMMGKRKQKKATGPAVAAAAAAAAGALVGKVAGMSGEPVAAMAMTAAAATTTTPSAYDLRGEEVVDGFLYVPSHLHHMLFELLKNSLRAVIERFGTDSETFPDVEVVMTAGEEDICIKISDEGGSVPNSRMPLLWTYSYTSVDRNVLDSQHDVCESTTDAGSFLDSVTPPHHHASAAPSPLAGFGYGLKLSRLNARYFGGDLRLVNMEGLGMSAYLHLSRRSNCKEPSDEIEEPMMESLPVFA
ncbi:hypothetical protein HK101_007430 [Irineochytrium annulatum]|nr:hypothetical protein HK101_007430 [Irineochytrium annulatum]